MLLAVMARETVLWPLLTTLILMVAGFFLRLPTSAAAIASGFLAGFSLIYGIHAFPPLEAQGWIPFLIIPNLLLFLIDDRISFPARIRLALQGLVSAASVLLLFVPLFKTGFSASAFIASIAIWFMLWLAIEHQEGPALFFAASGNAIVCATTGSTLLGQLGGVLAAVLAGQLVFNIPKTKMPMGHAGHAVSASILGSLMLIGHVYAETALLPSLLLFLAFAGPIAAKRIFRGRLQFVFGSLFALIPVAIASTIAIRSYLSQEY